MVSLVKRLTDLWQKCFFSWGRRGGVGFYVKGYAVGNGFAKAGFKSNRAP